MGKIPPKLSLSLQREFKVREALGLSRCSRKAQGHRRAQKAEIELTRRRRRLRSKKANWNSLCYELQNIILSKLSISDLYAVRLAGLGGTCVANTDRLRMLMRARCQTVHCFWKMWLSAKSCNMSRAQKERVGPIEFTSDVCTLTLRLGVEGLPSSIGEMRQLRYLGIGRGSEGMLAKRPALAHLPRELQQCQHLRVLRISFQHFEHFPQVVLELKRLKYLDMESNVRLKCLPENMGSKLQNLVYFNMRGCRKITALPESLLHRLETFKPRSNSRSPLLLGAAGFPAGYLNQTITSNRYPRLAECLRKKLMTKAAPWELEPVQHD